MLSIIAIGLGCMVLSGCIKRREQRRNLVDEHYNQEVADYLRAYGFLTS